MVPDGNQVLPEINRNASVRKARKRLSSAQQSAHLSPCMQPSVSDVDRIAVHKTMLFAFLNITYTCNENDV